MGARAGRRHLLRPMRPAQLGPSSRFVPGPPVTVVGANLSLNVNLGVPTVTLGTDKQVPGASAIFTLLVDPGVPVIGTDEIVIAPPATPALFLSLGTPVPVVGPVMPGDYFNAALPFWGLTGGLVCNLDTTSTEPGELFPGTLLTSATRTQWFTWTSPEAGTLILSPTTAGAYVLEVFQGESVADLDLLGEVAATGTLEVDLGDSERIWVRLGAAAAISGSVNVAWTFAGSGVSLDMEILSKEIPQTPSAINLALYNAEPEASVTFYVVGYGTALGTLEADDAGVVGQVSLPLPSLPAGTHTIRAVSGAREALGTFSVLLGPPTYPTTPIADTPPATTGQTADVLRWVFQDPMPGGLGSWYMGRNPEKMTSPHAPRIIDSQPVVGPDGEAILWEGGTRAHQWQFSGVLVTQADVEEMEEWAALNRRIYIVDHHNRAWVVTIETCEMVPVPPSKAFQQPWRHTYTVTCLIYEGPLTPGGS